MLQVDTSPESMLGNFPLPSSSLNLPPSIKTHKVESKKVAKNKWYIERDVSHFMFVDSSVYFPLYNFSNEQFIPLYIISFQNVEFNSESCLFVCSPTATTPATRAVTRCPAMLPAFIVMRSGMTVEIGLNQS